MAVDRIMVVIDPTMSEHPAFERALVSARMTGAQLHLYSCTCKPPEVPEGLGSEQALEQFRERVYIGLEKLAGLAQSEGVEAQIELNCAPDWRQEVVRAAARCRADMVFKYSFEHRSVDRDSRETGDWMLLRLSPCPVLMVKNFHDWNNRRVLGAINFASHDAAHVKLNNQIVSQAQRFADAYGSEAHFVTAYPDLNRVPNRAEIARICGVGEERVHLQHGSAAAVIREVAEKMDADLVLIGTVARSGLMGTVVGNTAERILDDIRSDVLVLN